MPRGGPPSYTYTLPAVYLAVPGTTILAVQHNSPLEDIADVLNDPWPTNLGGTGGTDAITSYDALNTRGTAVPTAASVNLSNVTGPNLHMTGTTTVTGVTLVSGEARQVIADAAFQLTASASLIVNGSTSVNYTTTAGDLLVFLGDPLGVTRVWSQGVGTLGLYLPLAGGTMTGAIVNAAGTVSLPSLTFTGDLNTGIYAIGADNIGVAAGGAKVLDIATTGLAVTGATSSTTTNTASAFIPSGSGVPTNGMYLPAANTLGFAINSGAEVQLTATGLSPATNDGNALGVSGTAWADLFLASGAVINFNAGNVTITHSANTLTTNAAVLLVSNATPAVAVNKSASGQNAVVAGATGGNNRWQVLLGNSTAESGSEVGSDFDIVSYTDAGVSNGPVLTIFRSTGLTQIRTLSRSTPVTKTADFTVAATENWIINNRAATNTATLPAAASWVGREIMMSTIQAQAVVSASSNVVPRAGGAAGTAILPATDGAWATLVSDGTNWIIMQSSG